MIKFLKTIFLKKGSNMQRLITFFLLLTITSFSHSSYSSEANTSEELIAKYPSIGASSKRAQNGEIICPFLRILRRSGVFDATNLSNNSDIMVSIIDLALKTREFGCGIIGCGSVATAVSAGQLSHPADILRRRAKIGKINLSNLTRARGVAHECGLTFSKGGKVISKKVVASTLAQLKKLSLSKAGRLSKDDLMLVKLNICARQKVKPSLAGTLEVGLIYTYLGGEDRGFIDYEDVVRFFNAQMPRTKAINYL